EARVTNQVAERPQGARVADRVADLREHADLDRAGHARRARPRQAHHAVDELGARRAEAEVAAQLYGDAGRVGRDQIADLPDAPAAESRPEDAWLALTRTEVSFRIGHHLGGAAGDR